MENLRAAMSEAAQRGGTHDEALTVAADARDEEMVTLFNETRDTEVEHANVFVAASRQLESMKTEKRFFACDRCEIPSDEKMPLCALCRTHEHPHAVE